MNLQRNPATLHLCHLFLLFVFLQSSYSSAVYSPSGGPVYVNPNAAPAVQVVQPTKVMLDTGSYVTQTVYGFLDFTTTIGNTVMVFSPQSAAPAVTPEPPKPVLSIAVNTVIETKPPPEVTETAKPEIKPSKASIVKPVMNQPMSSVVHVVASSPVEELGNEMPVPVQSVQIVSSHVEVVTEEAKPSAVMNKPIAPVKKPYVISTKVQVVEDVKSVMAQSSMIVSSRVEVKQETAPTAASVVVPHKVEEPMQIVLSSIVEVLSSDDAEPVLQVENNIGEPEYDFLSRQPSEFAEETYRVHNIKPSAAKAPHRTRQTTEPKKQNAAKIDSLHPTGLVTKLGGTVVKDGATTVHETSVIGTYISGKYAQVLQSTSHIFNAAAGAAKPKISPTPSLRILKTAAPHVPKTKQHIEPTPAKQSTAPAADNYASLPIDDLYGNSPSPNLVRSSRRPATSSGSFKNRFRNRNSKDEPQDYQEVTAPDIQATPAYNSPKKSRNNKSKNNNRFNNNRFSTSSVELATVSVFSETAASPPAYASRRKAVANRQSVAGGSGFKPTNTVVAAQSAAADNAYTRRFKPKLQASPVEQDHQTSSLYKFKLNRAPGRWQYKTSPKPRVTIRKQNSDDLQVAAPTPSYDAAHDNDIPIARSDDIDLDSSSSVNGDVLNDDETLENAIEHKKLPIETLKVEISTPVNFKDTYYEIATIKSPYTFQVGSVKNTRYITVTSTFEKSLDPEPTSTSILTEPLTENILATTAHIDKEHNLLDSSIATLPPILLSSDQETPPLETLTETFSTTQVMLKTHILPVIREGGGNATSYTLTQTYHITRLVTATKTLPPMEAYQFNPSKALKEFNSKLDEAGSELNLELDFGDDQDSDDDVAVHQELPADLDLSNIGSEFDLSEVDKTNIPEAHLRPKKKFQKIDPFQQQQQQQQQQQHQQQQQLIQQQHQNLSPDQLQQLALIRLYNPGAQLPPQLIMTSKPIVSYETVFESHVIPIFNGVSTSFSTISRPVATVTKTEYEQGQTTQLQQLPIPPPQPQQLNPLFQQQPQQPQYQVTTAPVITQTMITEIQSKVLKLTFGAKTAYTTLFSTAVVPTILTTYITQSIQVQPTAAAYPGYFPAPYPQFPYVG